MSPASCFVLIGHPVRHSVSPAIHAAAYRALGAAHRYDVVDCPSPSHVLAEVERLRRGEIAGANVTVPWKRLAYELADRRDESATRTGVANVLARDSAGGITASNTDAVALAEEIAALHAAPRSAAVIGSGGAAQAAVVACKMLGLLDIAVSSRSWRTDQAEASWKGKGTFTALGATACAWPEHATDRRPRVLAELLPRVDVIIQATSAGMHGASPGEAVSEWIPWRELKPGALAIDVVYNPPVTPFLGAAKEASVLCQGGLGMLVRQAAAAIRIWLAESDTWVAPPLGDLYAAAEQALAGQRQR
jgi:shikimate dehydrogenase